MTTKEPPDSQPQTRQQTMLFDGLVHIFRAGWVKTACGRKQRRYAPLVQTQDACHEFTHRSNSRRTSVSRVRNSIESRGLRGLNTMSHTGGRPARFSRTASRIRRFMRLRTTAFPIARGTVKPTRGPSSRDSCRRQNAANKGQECRKPWSYTFRKSLRRRIRNSFGNPNPGPATEIELAQFGGANVPLVTDSQLVTAPGAAPCENGSAVLGFHAGAKPVCFRAFAVIRLKRTFWHVADSRVWRERATPQMESNLQYTGSGWGAAIESAIPL